MKKVWLGLLVAAALGGGLLLLNSMSKPGCDDQNCNGVTDVVALDEEQVKVNREAFAQRFQRVQAEEGERFSLQSLFKRARSARASFRSVFKSADKRESINWKVVLMSGDDSIAVFDNARKSLRSLFEEYGVQSDNIHELSRSPREQVGDVQPTSVARFARVMAGLEIGENDGCAIFMSSHGSRRGFYIRRQGYLTPARLKRILNKTCKNRPTILLISACYSGIFVRNTGIATSNRIVMTAARHDRPSFGCSVEETYNFWDGCLLKHLPGADTWVSLAAEVTRCIEKKERAEGYRRSYPQTRIGASVAHLPIFDKYRDTAN